jgi:HlyD family secretion protein
VCSSDLVAFLHGLRSGGVELARTYAFTVMVFAQLLISLGARSQTTPIWRLDLFSNLNLLVVASASIVLQLWSHRNTVFSDFLETTLLSYWNGFILLAVSALPLTVLEIIKLASPAVAKKGRATAPRRALVGWTTAGVVALMAAGGWLYWPQPREAPNRFMTRAVERGSVVLAITATGAVGPRPTIEVFAFLTGVVEFRDCEVGVKVAKGQLCATIDQRPYLLAVKREQARLAAARAKLRELEAGLARAKSALERARALAKASRIDKATSAYKRTLERTTRSEELVTQREAALRVAEADFGRTEVRAPTDGTVISRGVETGKMVETGRTALFMITDPAVAQIEVPTEPGEVDKVEIGDRASIYVGAAPGRWFDARATEIHKAQNVVVLAAPDAERLLEPGTTATARIVIDRRDDVLRAPNEALRYSRSRGASQIGARGAGSGVTSLWVLRKGKPTPVPVRLGLDDGAHTEIVEGDFEPEDEFIVGEKA